MNDELVNALANDLGLSDIPLEDQRQLVEKFGGIALRAAAAAVMEKLSEEKRGEFMTISQSGDAEAIKKFLDEALPGHEELARTAVAAEVKAFKAAQAAAQ